MINESEGLSYCELMSRELYLITKRKIKWVTGASVEVQRNQNFGDSNTELVNTVYKCITNFRDLKLKNSAFLLDLRYTYFLMLRVTNKTNPCCDISVFY